MEWAAESGARVVSMSLGDTAPSDGSDPMSQEVDALSAQYGTLFVIAAGNAGPETISSPGAAASALTVGAVDKEDALASFSATGPLVRPARSSPTSWRLAWTSPRPAPRTCPTRGRTCTAR